MKKGTLIVCALVFCFSTQAQNLEKFLTSTDRFLNEYVKNGLVDYSSITKNPAELNTIFAE